MVDRGSPRQASVRLSGLWSLALLVGALLLAGCGLGVDAEQARICRQTLPALSAEGGRIAVTRTIPWLEPRSVRIAYRVERDGRPALDRHVVCRFAAEGLSPQKAELIGLSTEDGPVAGSTLYFLKRFYLGSPEGLAADPGPGDVAASAIEAPAPLAYALQQFFVGLPRAAIYGLLAVAYALIFGLVGRFNLAFGELAAVGAAASSIGIAMTLAVGQSTVLAGLLLGAVFALFAAAMHSAVAGFFTLARIPGASGQASLVASVGLVLVLIEYLRLAQGAATVWFPPVWSDRWPIMRAGEFVVTVTSVSIVTTSIGLIWGAGILLLMRRSGFGRAWRACADDAKAAALFGIDPRAVLIRASALGGASAGLSGTLVLLQYGGLGFAGGLELGLKALAAAILGGVGSVEGAFLGGVGLALFETLWSSLMPIDARDIALYCMLVALLVFRPGGLLGGKDATPRQV